MNESRINELLDIDRKLKAAKAALEELKDERTEVERALLEDFAEDGAQTIKLVGGSVYLKRDVFPKFRDGKSRADVVEWMHEHGGEFLSENYNGNQFNAFVREIDADGPDVAEGVGELLKIIDVSERFSLHTRLSR